MTNGESQPLTGWINVTFLERECALFSLCRLFFPSSMLGPLGTFASVQITDLLMLKGSGILSLRKTPQQPVQSLEWWTFGAY